jgi:hypothetical protein
MSNMTQNSNLHPDLGTTAQQYGMPINVAPPPSSGLTPTFLYDSESDHPAEGYPIDSTTKIEGGASAPSGSDRHALILNSSLCKLYEVYNLQNYPGAGQPWAAGSGATWTLSSDAMRPPGWTSADAAGLPMMPLLLRPDEILAGAVNHAVRFTAHCTANTYMWPASHLAGSCSSAYPPMGARFRLRSTFNISSFSADAQVVLRAFQHFGLILADNGSDWYFQGTTDDWWGTAAGMQVVSDLKTIPAGAFDAVDESSLQVAAGSYKAAASGGFASMGGYFIAGPGASSWGANRIDAFGVGGDRGLWQQTWSGTSWGGWAPLGGVITGDPGAVSWASGRIDVFVRGQDAALYHRFSDGAGWSGWEGLGGGMSFGPAVASWGSNRLDIFITGLDRQLWHRCWCGSGWGPWEPLGGVLTSKPAAISWASNRIDIVARGQDGQLWHLTWADGWSGWQPLGGQFSSGPTVLSCAAGHLDVYALGLDKGLWHDAFGGSSWSGWQPMGGYWTSDPGAVCSPGSTAVSLFERGTDGSMWHESIQGT